MATELKLCPFCGNMPRLFSIEKDNWRRARNTWAFSGVAWEIRCYCGVSGRQLMLKGEVINDWNRRSNYSE